MAMPPEAPPTVRAQLAHAERTLTDAGLPAPRDDALALLSRVVGVGAAALLAGSDACMTQSAVATYADWVARRAGGTAIAHITGHLAFMDLQLAIGPSTPLLPRYAPRIVEAALEAARAGGSTDLIAAELGTGCGAIALAAFEPRFARIYAVDPSPDALRTAAPNGARYLLNLVVSWLDGDGLGAVPEPVDVIVRARCGHAGSPRFADLTERAPAKLRPGGALICGLDRTREGGAVERLGRALPRAQVWAEPRPDGVVVMAQLPRAPEGAAAFDIRG